MSSLVRFWALSLTHEMGARGEEHNVRVVYAGRTPTDGASFLMIRHELAKRGAYDYKVPDAAYSTGELTGTVYA